MHFNKIKKHYSVENTFLLRLNIWIYNWLSLNFLLLVLQCICEPRYKILNNFMETEMDTRVAHQKYQITFAYLQNHQNKKGLYYFLISLIWAVAHKIWATKGQRKEGRC